jgi:hypothetical protein
VSTALCTDAERDLILAGARHLVVPGDPGCEGCHDRWTHAKIHGDEGWLPPQRWVDATGSCPTCGGKGQVWGMHHQPGDLPFKCVNPDCIDGRKRVALVAVCATCGDRAEWCGYEDGLPDDNPNCSAGSIVFAHATVEVLPVCWHDDPFPGDPCIVVYRDRYDQYVVLYRNDTIEQIWLDPLPVPGRDWVVLLDNVELAQ